MRMAELMIATDAQMRLASLGASGLVAVPSYAEARGASAHLVERFYQSANSDADQRIKLFRLAFDASISAFAGRQQLYERYYTGDPVRLGGTLFSIYDKQPHLERTEGILADIGRRAEQRDGAPRPDGGAPGAPGDPVL